MIHSNGKKKTLTQRKKQAFRFQPQSKTLSNYIFLYDPLEYFRHEILSNINRRIIQTDSTQIHLVKRVKEFHS